MSNGRLAKALFQKQKLTSHQQKTNDLIERNFSGGKIRDLVVVENLSPLVAGPRVGGIEPADAKNTKSGVTRQVLLLLLAKSVGAHQEHDLSLAPRN